MVMCLGQGVDLHMAQLMLLPLTISCSSKSRLVLPSWFYLSGAGSPGSSRTESKRAVKWLCVFVCVYIVYSPYCGIETVKVTLFRTLIYMLIAIGKGMWVVKCCLNIIIHFLTGVPANTQLYNGCNMVVCVFHAVCLVSAAVFIYLCLC